MDYKDLCRWDRKHCSRNIINPRRDEGDTEVSFEERWRKMEGNAQELFGTKTRKVRKLNKKGSRENMD